LLKEINKEEKKLARKKKKLIKRWKIDKNKNVKN